VDGGSTDGTVEYLESRGIPVPSQDQARVSMPLTSMPTGSPPANAVVVFFPKGTIPVDDLLESRPRLFFWKRTGACHRKRKIKGSGTEEDEHLLQAAEVGRADAGGDVRIDLAPGGILGA